MSKHVAKARYEDAVSRFSSFKYGNNGLPTTETMASDEYNKAVANLVETRKALVEAQGGRL